MHREIGWLCFFFYSATFNRKIIIRSVGGFILFALPHFRGEGLGASDRPTERASIIMESGKVSDYCVFNR